jgi:hypothetical protein
VRFRAGHPLRYRDLDGQEREVPCLRLTIKLLLGPDPVPPAPDLRAPIGALIDTGAPLSIIPKDVWQELFEEQQIPHVGVGGDDPPSSELGGCRYTWFLGRIEVAALDRWGWVLPAVPVIAKFQRSQDSESLPRWMTVVGLEGGFFDGRELTRRPTDEEFLPEPTEPGLAGRLPTYGQWWSLGQP